MNAVPAGFPENEPGGAYGDRISETREFGREELAELFLAAGWDSGEHPDRLLAAMKNAHAVFSAWSGELLIGLPHAIPDGAMVADIPHMPVRPGWQGRGKGLHGVLQGSPGGRESVRLSSFVMPASM